MSWKSWKIGILVALGLSVFVSLAGLAAGGGWKVLLSVFGSACLTHFGAFLKDHSIEEITETITKPVDKYEQT